MAAFAGARLLHSLPALAQDQNAAKPSGNPPAGANPDAAQAGATPAKQPPPKPDCYASKTFGQWTAQATDAQAGAKLSQISFNSKCDLLGGSFSVSDSYDARLVLFGDPDATKLRKKFLLNDDNRVIAKSADGKTLDEAKLCGVCADIFDDKVSIILPLTFSALLRSEKQMSLVVRLGKIEDCGFDMQLDPLRQALAWATKQHQALSDKSDEGACNPPQQCFMTTACCSLLGLPDDCFELSALRRYRDEVLAQSEAGRAAIGLYYRTAPDLLAAMRASDREALLLSTYWRFILPSAIAAHLGLNRLAFRLYAGMMRGLTGRLLPELQVSIRGVDRV
jgi:hypothetical protein